MESWRLTLEPRSLGVIDANTGVAETCPGATKAHSGVITYIIIIIMEAHSRDWRLILELWWVILQSWMLILDSRKIILQPWNFTL